MIVLDSSALLVLMFGEPGHEKVEAVLWTADTAWAQLNLGVAIEVIR